METAREGIPGGRKEESIQAETGRERGRLVRGVEGIGNLYWIRRLHSLSGLLPFGVFLFFHFWENSYALAGPAVYNRVVLGLEAWPYLPAIEILFLGIPILFHLALGLTILLRARWNPGRYRYGRNWMFFLQRFTGLAVLIFLLYHVPTLRLVPGSVSFARVAAELRSPVVLGLYLLGVLAAAYHLGGGLWNFLIHWGITVGPRAQRWSLGLSGFIFLFLIVVGFRIIAAFAGGV